MNWLPNDLSAEGASSLRGEGVYPPWKILKIGILEMPFPAIWALNYEHQFDFKKEKPWKLCHISEFDFFAPLMTKALCTTL